MDVYEAIMTRRMTPKVGEARPSRQEIEMLIAAAMQAPNHHLTRPWRFIVLAGEALDGLGEAMARRAAEKYGSGPGASQKVELERSKPKRAPLIIAVIYVKSNHPKAVEVEDRYAVGAAVENMLLAAHGMGLGAFWRTGPASENPSVHEFLGLDKEETVAAFVYLGYPQDRREPADRTEDLQDRTTWMGVPPGS
ncbi:MAG: nitroreductase family protein [Actinomycetota bacterium]